jgi:hypothetical protein
MPRPSCLPTIALALSLLGGSAFADGRSAPGGPAAPEPRQPVAVLPLVEPRTGPVGFPGQFRAPPTLHGLNPDAAKDAAVDAVLGVGVQPPPPGIPASQSFAIPEGEDRQALLETSCQHTNGGYSKCIVYDCDGDGVCVEYGAYCVSDSSGAVGPCP